jgi:uncharacterized protein
MSDYAPPDAGSHELPSVPMARPVLAAQAGEHVTVAYAPAVAGPMLSRRRAVAELLALIPAAIVGSVIAWAVLTYLIQPAGDAFDERWYNVGTSLIVGLTMMVAVVLMVRLGGGGAASIGWTSRRLVLDAWIGLAVFVMSVFLAALLAATLFTLNPDLLDHEPKAPQVIRETFPPLSFGAVVAVMMFVAIWEEVVFRGFMLTRLYALLRRWWLVLPVGAVLFGVPHLYQGVLAVTVIIVLALIMGTLFIWRRSLVAPIVFHLANNVVVMLILGRLPE